MEPRFRRAQPPPVRWRSSPTSLSLAKSQGYNGLHRFGGSREVRFRSWARTPTSGGLIVCRASTSSQSEYRSEFGATRRAVCRDARRRTAGRGGHLRGGQPGSAPGRIHHQEIGARESSRRRSGDMARGNMRCRRGTTRPWRNGNPDANGAQGAGAQGAHP